MFWFDKKDPRAVFGDNRELEDVLCDGRNLSITPDIKLDFRSLPFNSGHFALVVFDPPHLIYAGESSWVAKKYGVLAKTWEDDIRAGFSECFRVLRDDGVLIFKWNETQIKVSELLALTPNKPLFGHRSGKASNTHWITFMKPKSK